MKSKHTPMPWTFKAVASCGDEPCRWEILGAGGVVAETNDNTSNADAKLIAAAPEMLDALRLALTCLDAAADGRLEDVKDEIGGTANIVDEVITKATQ